MCNSFFDNNDCICQNVPCVCHCCVPKCIVGPMGPRGPQGKNGPMGLVGPMGPPGPKGEVEKHALVLYTKKEQTISAINPLLYETVLEQEGDCISYKPKDTDIVLHKKGLYLVHYNAVVRSGQGCSFPQDVSVALVKDDLFVECSYCKKQLTAQYDRETIFGNFMFYQATDEDNPIRLVSQRGNLIFCDSMFAITKII